MEFDMQLTPQERAVWDRVLSGRAPDRCSLGGVTKQQWKEFLDAEVNDTGLYRSLARCSTGWRRRVLMELAAEEAGHVRRLSEQYHKLYGSWPSVTARVQAGGDMRQALKERYDDEVAGAGAYAAAASRETGDTRRMLEELSRDEARHSQAITALLEQ